MSISYEESQSMARMSSIFDLQDKIEVLEATVKKLADRVTLLEKPSKPTLPTPAPPPPPPPTTPENPKPPKAESKSVKVK